MNVASWAADAGAKNAKNVYPSTLMGTKFLKNGPYGCKVCTRKRGRPTFKRLFLTVNLSNVELPKFQRCTLIWVQKSAKPKGRVFSIIQVSTDVHLPPGPQKVLFFKKDG